MEDCNAKKDHPGQPVGERLHRELQRAAARRASRRRDLLHIARGPDRHQSWRRHYNTVRPHASIGYRAPAPEVFVPALAAWPAAQSRPAPPAMLPLAPRPTPKLTFDPDHLVGAGQLLRDRRFCKSIGLTSLLRR